MLEIMAVLFLSNTNGKNAIARGRKPGFFQGITFALWFGVQLIVFLIGMAATDGEALTSYAIALLCAALGGVASYLIAKNCKPGDYVAQQPMLFAGETPLAAGCMLTIAREKNFASSLVPYTVFLNGQQIGVLKNGESLQAIAAYAKNMLVIKDAYGTELPPLYFQVDAGSQALVVFGPRKILPEKSGGMIPLAFESITAPSAPGLANTAPITPPIPQPEQAGRGLGSAGIVSPALQPVTQAAPAATATPLPLAARPQKPMLAVWVLCSALAFMLLGTLTFFRSFSRSYYPTLELTSIASPLILGAAIYLILQDKVKYSLYSVGGVILEMFVKAFSSTYLGLFMMSGKAPTLGQVFTATSFPASLRATTIFAILPVAVTMIVSVFMKGVYKQRLTIAAWGSAGAVLIYSIINLRTYYSIPNFPGIMKAGLTISSIGDAACIALFALLVYMACTLRSEPLQTGTGAKIWFGVCAGATFITAIIGMVGKTMGIAGLLVALAGVGGYILLMLSKRIGFPIVLCVVLMTVMSGISVGFLGYESSVLNGIAPLFGLVNPLITWFVIRGAWQSAPQPVVFSAAPGSAPYPVGYGVVIPAKKDNSQAMAVAYIVGAAVNIVLGAILFVAGVSSIAHSYRFPVAPLVFGVILGSGLMALGVISGLQCFKKMKRRQWLLVTQFVIACIGFLIMSIGFLTSL